MGCAGTCVLMTHRVSMNYERDVLVDCLLAQVAIDVEKPRARSSSWSVLKFFRRITDQHPQSCGSI